MPALPAVNLVIKCILSGNINGTQPWLTRHYIQFTGTQPTVAQLTTFNSSILTAYNADLQSLADTECNLKQIETQDLTSSTGAVAISSVASTGTRGGSVLPAQVCAVTSYTIGRRYRGGHPRGYWRFGVEADVSSPSGWTGAFVTAVNTGIQAYFSALLTAGWTGAGTLKQVNVSYYAGFTVVTNPITGRARNVPKLRVTPVQDVVTTQHCQSSIGTQRRRETFID